MDFEKLSSSKIAITVFTNGQGGAQFICCYAMPAEYHLSITAVQGQPHHRLAHSATLPVSAYTISNAHCFKFPSISVIFKSTVYLPPVKLNGGDYQKMMHVQELQLCSSYSH